MAKEKDNIVQKVNGLTITAKNEYWNNKPSRGLSPVSQKLVTLLMILINEDTSILNLSVTEILKYLSIQKGGSSYQTIYHAIEEVSDIKFNMYDPTQNTFIDIKWFKSFTLNKGSILLEIDEAIVSYICKYEKNYSRINWFYPLFLKLKYSQRIYEILMSNIYKCKIYDYNKNKITDKEKEDFKTFKNVNNLKYFNIKLKEFQKLIGGTKEMSYSSYSEFYRSVLKNVLKEINAYTHLTILAQKKVILKETYICFVIEEKDSESIENLLDNISITNESLGILLDALRTINLYDKENHYTLEEYRNIRKSTAEKGRLVSKNEIPVLENSDKNIN